MGKKEAAARKDDADEEDDDEEEEDGSFNGGSDDDDDVGFQDVRVSSMGGQYARRGRVLDVDVVLPQMIRHPTFARLFCFRYTFGTGRRR